MQPFAVVIRTFNEGKQLEPVLDVRGMMNSAGAMGVGR
jgi:hypothetical protein